jgi:Restriction Enzyme Adenine Methylase Associated
VNSGVLGSFLAVHIAPCPPLVKTHIQDYARLESAGWIMPREARLVSQYLERVSRAAVEKYRQLFTRYVKGRQGVYALYRGDKLYYVGLASNLRSRLQQHLKDHHGNSWDRFSLYFTIGERHLKELETLILHVTGKPPGNEAKGSFKGSENLQRQVKKDIRMYHRDELMDLMGQSPGEARATPLRNEKIRRQPVLAAYLKRPLKLRATIKGKTFNARVRRDGSIRFRGKTYNSPSGAGGAACKRSCDGWRFWKYERAPGDWVKLHELRR